MLPDWSLAQPCPPSPCANCDFDCLDPCSLECTECVAKPVSEGGCQGADVPISDHAGYLLVGGLIIVSAYFFGRGKVVVN
jgi:hypothetical protein